MFKHSNNIEYYLITSSNFPSGGASAVYLNLLCKGLNLNSRKVSVWLLKGHAFGNQIKSDKTGITEDGIKFKYLSSTSRQSNLFKKIIDDLVSIFTLVFNLFKLFNRRKSVTILVYNDDLHFNLIIYPLSKIFKFKLVSFVFEYYDKADFQQSLTSKIKWYWLIANIKIVNPLSDCLIVFSDFLRHLYITKGFNENQIYVQPNLTDFDFWKNTDTSIKYQLGYSGTPSMKDGLPDLLQALSLLQSQGLNLSLLVIGDSVFGKSLIPNIKNVCRDLQIENLVTFTGLVSLQEVKDHISQCRILVLTRPNTIQTKAGFPTKLGEYFASEKQILVTDFGDIEKYFKKDTDIVIAECGNIIDIASNIRWMIENPADAERISISGYSTAEALLEYKKSVLKLIKFLEKKVKYTYNTSRND